MGIVYTHVRLANTDKPQFEEIDADALVDTGAQHLCIPAHIPLQLGLTAKSSREIRMADDSVQTVPYVGPIRVSLLGRECFTGALVLGKQVLLGAIPLEDMDLLVHPAKQVVTVNPANPNAPMSLAMGVRLKDA